VETLNPWSIYWTPLMPEDEHPGPTHHGYSITAARSVDFIVEKEPDGSMSWRETVECPVTHLSSRVRAAYHMLISECDVDTNSRIYCTEAITAFYKFLKSEHPNSIGSEYLPHVPWGQVDENGVRSEDLTRLSFETDSLDAIVTLDVFEHVPDFRQGLRECARVLRPGGGMIFTAPFHHGPNTTIRAEVIDGEVVNHLEPQYHGDPLGRGILCYQEFGYDILGEMRDAGFSDAYVGFFSGKEFGYLGGLSEAIVAIK
jgi:SAM-dependent methyltransferase